MLFVNTFRLLNPRKGTETTDRCLFEIFQKLSAYLIPVRGLKQLSLWAFPQAVHVLSAYLIPVRGLKQRCRGPATTNVP